MGLLIKLIDENGPLSELVKEIPTYYLKRLTSSVPTNTRPRSLEGPPKRSRESSPAR